MALHSLHVCGTSTFQATTRDAEVQLYEIDILCMTWPYPQFLYPALATIGSSAQYFSSDHSWVGSEQVLYELFLTPNWYYHTVPSRDTTTVCAQLVSPHVERFKPLSGHLSPQPCLTLLRTCCRTASEAVEAAMWSAFTGMTYRRSIRSIVSSGTGAVTTVSDKGHRLRPSALPCLQPSRHTSS